LSFVGIKISPYEVAKKIVDQMGQNPWIGEVDVARAGFINVTVNKTHGSKALALLLQKGVQPPPLEKKLRVVVDFSSPNIAKEMHVGHLRYACMHACMHTYTHTHTHTGLNKPPFLLISAYA
jgi:arginyl-tRNA synthetase